MKMDQMNEYFEKRGFEVSRRRENGLYVFTISKDGNVLEDDFMYPATASYSEVTNAQRKFMENMMKCFAERYYKKVDDHHYISKGENMKNIKWKVGAVDVNIEPYSVPEISVELHADFNGRGPFYYHPQADAIAKEIESKLNPPDKIYITSASRSCGKSATLMDLFDEYVRKDIEMTESIYRHTNIQIPTIKDVIFNDPATIVFWTDGTKTVVKCQEGDIFDPEKGLTMAIAKKVYGNKGSYCNVIKKWCDPYHEEHDYSDAVTKAVYEKLSTICDALTEKYGHKESD